MDTMRREMIWAGGLLACVVAVAIGARAADSVPVKVESDTTESAVILLGDVRADQLVPLPETYTVTRRYPDGHPMQNALAGVPESCLSEETKEIYSSKNGMFSFRPRRGRRIADDLITELVRNCSICSLRVRVTGGVEDGDDTFRAEFSLYDGCPAAGEGGVEIPGTKLTFNDLEDDAGQFHDLMLDFTDRGQCDDGTCPTGEACQVSLQNCTAGSCADGSACDPSVPACADGSDCTHGICSDDSSCNLISQDCDDQSECRRSCEDGTLCELICGGASECVRAECSGDPCSLAGQNCTGGLCADGSACDPVANDCVDKSDCLGAVCLEDPLEIPPTVWLRLRFDTDDAAVVMGSPPTRGFSADAYDDPQGFCTAWFAGWPVFPHATMFAEILAPATCETHFLAYLAANPNKPAFLPSQIGQIPNPPGQPRPVFTTPTTRLGDDITLTVEDCTLSAYELGMKGNIGEFTMDIDLRWPDVLTIQQDTVATFHGRGLSSAEVGHFTIDEDVNLSININDQPIVITWKSNKSNTGAMEVNITQAGTSSPTMLAFNVDLDQPGIWSIIPDGDFTPAVFYAAIFCRGDAPRGACCPNQAAIPGSDMNCEDGDLDENGIPIGVPVTSCLGTRWQINSTCEENLFNPPCGTHSCCPPDTVCDNLTFDDCVEKCITDVDPIFCEPVCRGGENHRQSCDPANGDDDCPDGVCDRHALCPGQRTCGLTGCQLGGEFTGRPCDLNNPDQGASDCMTCSGSGDYCRPRCTGGIRVGRPCDDDTDCPGTGSTCDNGFDCDGAQTCDPGQVCVHSDSQCGLRCSRWGSGRFCGLGDQFCPNFTCFDAVGDCFDDEDEHGCMGRCSESRPCTSDDGCDGLGGVCLPSGQCSGKECHLNSQCEPNLGFCSQSDVDCPLGTRCLVANRICTGREGCDNLDCCGVVCRIRPQCCDGAVGETWDRDCVATANQFCTTPPGNDLCNSNAPNEGAFEIALMDDDTAGLPCTPQSESCSGDKIANLRFALTQNSEPGFCCNKLGVGVKGAGTVWFKFKAVHQSAKIHNCDTSGSSTRVNSLIQVFKALVHTDDGTDEDECDSLEAIGCNDDSGICGSSGDNCEDGLCLASVCVINLNPGEIYYVMVAASKGENQGVYEVDIESPCRSFDLPPFGSVCEDEQPLPDSPAGVPFDLANATIDCPPESCLPNMINDTWYLAQATCPGNMIVQTCSPDPGVANPDTTLAVYALGFGPPFVCPPTELVGCNDDATINPVCSIGGDACEVNEDCNRGCSGPGTPEQCKLDADCPGNSRCDLALRAICETVPGKCRDGTVCDPDEGLCSDGFLCSVGLGDSSEALCLLAPCATASDCPGTSCVEGICDPQCNRGVCEDDLVTLCDASIFPFCADGSPCNGIVDCADGSDCELPCGFSGVQDRPWECLGQESCVLGECRSACAPASYVVVPTFQNEWYFVRVGGEFGSEPAGTLRLSCEFDDCNGNAVPDGIEIESDPTLDCNGNGELDWCDINISGFSSDCNCNELPDECEIDVASVINCSRFGGLPCDEGPFFCFNTLECDADVNDNGIPDCCDEVGVPPAVCPQCPVVCGIASVTGVVFADADPIAPLAFDQPVGCSIDAREPHEIGNAAVRFGWDRMVISFSCDPAPIGIVAGDFTVSGVPAGVVPAVSSVVINSPAMTATVVLSNEITPGQWTCIEHVPSGNEWCMGYLPADAGQDGLTVAGDINALINAINLVPGLELPIYATDINRSGTTTGADILRLIDLLNGAGDFNPWITQALPACPP